MELLYVWIEDYKNIKNQGFNFAADYKIDLEIDSWNNKTKHAEKGTLTIKKQDRPNMNSFWNSDKIKNVTAIIGGNGAGKTNLLEFITDRIPNKHGLFVMVYKLDGNLYFYKNHAIEITSEHIIERKLYDLPNQDTDWVYYSANLQKKNFTSTYDLSLYGQLKNCSITPVEGESINFEDIFNLFQITNTQNQIHFLSNYGEILEEKLSEPFPVPKHLEITIGYQDLNKSWNVLLDQIANEIGPPLNNEDNDVNLWSKVENAIGLSILSQLFEESIFKLPITISESEFLFFPDFTDLSTNFFYEVIDKLERVTPKNSYETKLIKEAKNAYSKAEELAYLFAANRVFDAELYLTASENNVVSKIPVNLESHKNFDVLDLYKKKNAFLGKKFSKNINFSWVGLSAAEEIILNQLAVLNMVSLKNESTIITIDEGEVTLHPQWQKRYFNLMINILPLIIKNKFQLIFASHSPFLVSDLPKENIIFLNKGKDGLCKVKPPEDITSTFGANIHSLYRNSFFLENGLMGEFAKGKIDQAIKDLNSEEEFSERRMKEIGFIIDQIGEPLIKEKLLQKYKHRFEPLEDRINALKLEIEKLESTRRN